VGKMMVKREATAFPKIPRFEWSDLDGKELKIIVQRGVSQDARVQMVWGKDKQTGILYLLHSEFDHTGI
jgi:hypothetical protein